ncbi:hypothetical protein D9M68_69040 [compost metagenome]
MVPRIGTIHGFCARGGLSIKLHLAIDAIGRPLRSITEGQTADISCAMELIEGLRAQAVIADKGYDANAFMQARASARSSHP